MNNEYCGCCDGSGYHEEGDPEIGSVLAKCKRCNGTGTATENRPNGWNIRHYPDGVAGGVAFNCPACGSESWVHFDADTGWVWDGNKEAPSLTPSIGQRCCTWHGYLTAGKFIPC